LRQMNLSLLCSVGLRNPCLQAWLLACFLRVPCYSAFMRFSLLRSALDLPCFSFLFTAPAHLLSYAALRLLTPHCCATHCAARRWWHMPLASCWAKAAREQVAFSCTFGHTSLRRRGYSANRRQHWRYRWRTPAGVAGQRVHGIWRVDGRAWRLWWLPASWRSREALFHSAKTGSGVPFSYVLPALPFRLSPPPAEHALLQRCRASLLRGTPAPSLYLLRTYHISCAPATTARDQYPPRMAGTRCLLPRWLGLLLLLQTPLRPAFRAAVRASRGRAACHDGTATLKVHYISSRAGRFRACGNGGNGGTARGQTAPCSPLYEHAASHVIRLAACSGSCWANRAVWRAALV